jgi:hypothetical protein
MEYWRGYMDWKLDNGWVCPTCGKNEGLEWGLVHAQCRCNVCHTEFTMRNKDEAVVTTPICMLKDEYKEPVKKIYDKYQVPIEEMTDEMFNEFIGG